jgi:hypothetical protein
LHSLPEHKLAVTFVVSNIKSPENLFTPDWTFIYLMPEMLDIQQVTIIMPFWLTSHFLSDVKKYSFSYEAFHNYQMSFWQKPLLCHVCSKAACIKMINAKT